MGSSLIKRLSLLAALVVVVAGATTAYFLVFQDNGGKTALRGFANDWNQGKLDGTAYAGLSSADVAAQYKTTVGSLASTPVHVTVGHLSKSGNKATATLHVSWSLGGENWNYDTRAQATKTSGTWKIIWAPSVIEPSLGTGDHLSLQRTQPTRADILDTNGQPLMTARPTVDVGISPQRTPDAAASTKALADLVHVDGAALLTQVKAAKPDAFVEVITLRRADYDAMKAQLQPIPGTVFREGSLPLAPTRQFASALLGRVGPATAEIVKNSNGRYQAGDNAGLSGLELQYDSRLAGTAGVTVGRIPADPNKTSVPLFSIQPKPGSTVQTTLDSKAQQAAEDAIAGQTKPASFVAIKASTGQVLAVANGPDVGGSNRALVGQYPPGSSFKVITTYALLQKGVTANDNVACPPTITVNGRSFHNAENEAFASAPFHVDFAKSCNTAFISLAPKVSGTALPDAAAAFGLGTPWSSGVATYSGSVPKPTTDVDVAAAAFGQGKLLMSPLAMANVAAGVDRGSAKPPTLVSDPTPPSASAAALPLDANALAALRPLMREVVTSGTGSAIAHAPGGDVYGKTGTAEFGTADPPQAHAWFIGYQGDIAFAAFVEGGEFGGDTAAPIANKFLTSMAS